MLNYILCFYQEVELRFTSHLCGTAQKLGTYR